MNGQSARAFVIGVTGTFGSGKTTVSGMLAETGALVLEADTIAHEALEKKNALYQKILDLFPGTETDTGLDRKKIAEIIFRDEAKRRQLEALVHPYVYEKIQEKVAAAKGGVIVLDIPLLYETGGEELCDWVIVVSADPKTIQERLKKQNFKEDEISKRQKAQLSLDKKKQMADWVIDNSKTINETRSQLNALLEKLNFERS